MKRFDSLGALLGYWREARGWSQAGLADHLSLNARTVGRWERDESGMGDKQLVLVAKRTALPLEALVRLRAGLATWYDATTNRLAPSPFERDFVNRKILREELLKVPVSDLHDVSSIGRQEVLGRILEIEGAIHPLPESGEALFARAMSVLPNLNLALSAPCALHEGHILTFPLSEPSYSRLRERETSERSLRPENLAAKPSSGCSHIHVYALYATCSAYAYWLLNRFVRELLVHWESRGHQPTDTLSWYAVSSAEAEIADKMDLRKIYIDDMVAPGTRAKQFKPVFYERRLGDLKWLGTYAHARMGD